MSFPWLKFVIEMKYKTISITGGGIAGLTTAIALNRVGIQTTLFEAKREIKPVGAGLGLGANAMKAFDALGLGFELRNIGRYLKYFVIYDHCGRKIISTGFNNRIAGNFTIHRAQLHDFLLSHINSGTTIELGKKLVDTAVLSNCVKLFFSDGSTHITNYLIIADGIHSPIRQKLFPGAVPRYAGYACWRAVISKGGLNISETSETWGPKGRFGIVPLANSRTYWFACINYPQNDERAKNTSIRDLRENFRDYRSPIPEILEQSENVNLIRNDIIDLEPLESFSSGRIVLVGDAAHATTPNMGQGACQAIEDAVVLAECMDAQPDFEKAFKMFEERRLKRTRWITTSSRKIGRIAQIENPFLIHVRNALMRCTPSFVGESQQKKLESVNFTKSTTLYNKL